MRLYVSVRGQSALFRKVRFFSPGQTRRRLTEKRILQPAGHGKAQSACALSRKSALCTSDLTEKRTLRLHLDQKAHSACERSRRLRLSVTVGPRGCPECAFPSQRGHRMRLCVSVRGQSAPFRKLRFFSPGQTWRRLTEKRILRVPSHGKAHSAYAPHQKTHPTCERSRTLHQREHATTRLPAHRTPVPQALRPEVHI